MSTYNPGEFFIRHVPMQSMPLGVAHLEFLRSDGDDTEFVTVKVPVRVSVFVDLREQEDESFEDLNKSTDRVIRHFNPNDLQYSCIIKDEAEEDYFRKRAVMELKKRGLETRDLADEHDLGDRMYRLLTEALSDDSMIKGPGAFAMTLDSMAGLMGRAQNTVAWSAPKGNMPKFVDAIHQRAHAIRDLLHEMLSIERGGDVEAAEAAEAANDSEAG